ncbi:MAG: 3-oxoacyl-[acyl-carrier-protein] synthase III C-terminal domain-containing protein [Bacteroidota bacterium]|nr:3-oxoacyl-[acyl-carrier-protein] synthase III C-terminal domain-containing protein [Bacteroidota bacterium]
MKLTFNNKRISGILTVLPRNELKFDDEVENYNFPPAKSMKLKLAMGYNTHRLADSEVCASDLCIAGLDYLFQNELLDKNEIDALLFVSQSPDYFLPPTSNIIQGHYGMKQDMICMDINQGCAGYELGLIQAFMLLEQDSINRVVLLNADVLSSKVSKQDRNSYPLAGDAASVTIVEKNPTGSVIHCAIKMDGTGAFALMIPAGGFRMPCSAETAIMREDEDGNIRSLNQVIMKGDEIFNFVQREVPPMIEELLTKSGLNRDDIDWYMFHQPNRFMLNKLADTIGVDREKMPSNIVGLFGNASSVTVPTNISYNLGDKLCHNQYKLCLAGFGVGLTWAAIIMEVGQLRFNKMIEC